MIDSRIPEFPGLSPTLGAKKLPSVTPSNAPAGPCLVHPAQVKHQFGVAVGLQDHGDAPVLLVEVARCVIRDFAVLGLRAITRGRSGRDVEDPLRHVR